MAIVDRLAASVLGGRVVPLRRLLIDRFRRFWDSSLDRLDAHLAAVQTPDRLDKKEH